MRHRDGGYVIKTLEPLGQRQADQLGGAQHVGLEQVAIGEAVINQRRWVHDVVHLIGQPREIGFVQSQFRRGQITGQHFQVPRRERPEVRRQLGVRVADSLVEPCPRGGRVGAADQADEFAIDLRQLFQPLQVQEAAEEAVGIGQQHRLNIADGRRRHFRRRQRLRVEQRLKVEVRGTDARGVWVHLFIARQRAGVAQSVVDIGGQTCGARRGMQNEADRHGDAEHLLEQQRQATAPKESPPRSP